MNTITRLISRLQGLKLRFGASERGAVAIIVALAVVPLMVAGGLAVDLSRAYLTKSRLAHALDAAGLAVGSMRTTSTSSAYLETQFNNFFTANYPNTEVGTTHDITFVDNGGIITVTGKATVETVFMSIVGVDSITVGSTAQITVETNGLELVMVLDNTGSMASGGRMTTMKAAAHDLIDIVFGDEATPDLLKVGLVPFSHTVNIGTGNAAYVSDTDIYSWGSYPWQGCVMARSNPADVNDTDIATDGTWDPYYFEYYAGYSVSNHNTYCPPEITPLTNVRTTLDNGIDAMVTSGGTHINLGAIWGWRTISPEAPYTEGATYDDPDWTKAVILLTDGENYSPNTYIKTGYGYLPDGNLGTTSSSSAAISELNDRVLDVCTGMKNEGIVVYTIAFGSSIPASTASMMSDCATDADKYFESPDNATLTTAFRAIGAELKNLHLSQ